MARLILALFLALSAQAQTVDYNEGDWLDLDDGIAHFSITDGASTTVLSVPPISTVSTAARVEVKLYIQFSDEGGSVVACANPCSIRFPRLGGDAVYVYRYRNSGGTILSTSDEFPLKTATPVNSSTIELPIELVGFENMEKHARFTVSGTPGNNLRLYLQVHGLTYESKGSVKINDGSWVAFTDANLDERLDYCGIAGGFGGQCATQKFTMDIPDGLVVTGTNTVRFRFNGSAWNSSGYRVLAFNILQPATTLTSVVISSSGTLATYAATSHGLSAANAVFVRGTTRGGFRATGVKTVASAPNANSFTVAITSGTDGTYTDSSMTISRGLVPPASFSFVNYASWTPPLDNAPDIAAGETLWETAALLEPEPTKHTITATCSSCHADDGRDLKYFNFSNESIIGRAIYHGLNYKQGQQIASYIRSLTTPNPAHAWTPLFQPGPGLSSVALENWSAGMGLDWVLNGDADRIIYLTADKYASTAHLNTMDVPESVQFFDWNQWLPKRHPQDSYGSTFTSHQVKTRYDTLLSNLVVGNQSVYAANLGEFEGWKFQRYEFVGLIRAIPGFDWTLDTGQEVYSVGQWLAVKHWFLFEKYELGDFGDASFATVLSNRMWNSNALFALSPNQVQLDRNTIMVAAGPQTNTHNFMSQIWYLLQQQTNSSDGAIGGIDPMDWGYIYSFYDTLSNHGHCQWPSMVVTSIRALQAFSRNANGVEVGGDSEGGFEPNTSVRPAEMVNEWNMPCAKATLTTAEMALIMQRYITAWYNKFSSYTPAQYYTGGWATAGESVPAANVSGPLMGEKIKAALPRFKHLIELGGGDSTIINTAVDFMKTIYTTHGASQWEPIKTATCSYNSGNGHHSCSSDNN